MKKQSLLAALILTVLVGGPVTLSWACKSAGPNKHIGSVTAIDAKVKTFTIQDAETDHAMTFEATDQILKELKLNARVMVDFKEDKGKMIAVEVKS